MTETMGAKDIILASSWRKGEEVGSGEASFRARLKRDHWGSLRLRENQERKAQGREGRGTGQGGQG